MTLTIEPHLRVFAGLAELENKDNKTEIVDSYPTSEAAFTAAVDALKALI